MRHILMPHFIVLDKHEFENYLLDEKIFSDLITRHNILSPAIIPMNPQDIKTKIFELVEPTKDIVFRKHLSKLNGNSIGKLLPIFRKRDVPISNLSDYTDFILDVERKTDVIAFLNKEFDDNFKECLNNYSATKWDSSWQTLCDGKAALGIVINFFANHLQITKKRLKDDIKETILQNSRYEINKVINEIIKKYDVAAN